MQHNTHSLKGNNRFWHTRKTYNGNTEEPFRVKKCCDFAVGDTMTRTLPIYIRRPMQGSHSKQARARSKAWLYITLVKASLTLQRFHRFHSAGASLWRWNLGKDVRSGLLEKGDLLCTERCCI